MTEEYRRFMDNAEDGSLKSRRKDDVNTSIYKSTERINERKGTHV